MRLAWPVKSVSNVQAMIPAWAGVVRLCGCAVETEEVLAVDGQQGAGFGDGVGEHCFVGP